MQLDHVLLNVESKVSSHISLLPRGLSAACIFWWEAFKGEWEQQPAQQKRAEEVLFGQGLCNRGGGHTSMLSNIIARCKMHTSCDVTIYCDRQTLGIWYSRKLCCVLALKFWYSMYLFVVFQAVIISYVQRVCPQQYDILVLEFIIHVCYTWICLERERERRAFFSYVAVPCKLYRSRQDFRFNNNRIGI